MNNKLQILKNKHNLKDWVECTLGEVVKYSKGKKPKVLETEIKDNINIPYINIKAFEKDIFSEYTDGVKCNLCEEGDLLMVWDGARAGLTGKARKGAVGSTLMKIESLNDSINKEYLYYFLLSKYTLLNTNPRGVGIPHVEPNLLWHSKFVIYNSTLQSAIVKKIATLFSSLDSGIADLKKAQKQLKIYRQAVLKKAFEGDWRITVVGELFDFIGGGTPSKKEPKFWNGNIPWASVKDIKGDFLTSTQDFITEDGLNNSSSNLAKRNEIILITRITPGKSIISAIDTAINQDLKIVKPKFETFNKFVHFLFKSTENEVFKLSSGTTVKGINLNNLKSIKVPKIPLQEQHQIVQEIESRLSVCDTVEKNIKDSLEKSEALRQSILKKAFEGKLLSEAEIAECKAHPNYEPAKVLLEKIKAEKLGKPIKTKKTKKKPPIPQKISTDIQAGVIAKVIKLHEENPKYLDNLSHVKCEKISHLVEYHLQIPLGRKPVKDAAGPDDYSHLKKVEHRAKMAGYFSVVKKEIGHSYSSNRNIQKIIDTLEKKMSIEQKRQLDKLVQLFLKFDLESAEIVATLYAGWNNLLLEGKQPTDDEIVFESRENWSKRKLKIKRERFYEALNWMRRKEIALIPKGDGLPVVKPK